MTDPREPFETDSPVEGGAATDLDDARLGEPGAVDLDTGADETGLTRSRRPASTRPAGREGSGTRSRAAAERARAESGKKRSLARFLREVVAELRKVIWPGRRELITYTTVVIVFVAFMVALVAGLDLLFAKGVIAVFG